MIAMSNKKLLDQSSPGQRSLQKLSLVFPKARSQLLRKFWLVQKLWMRLHSVFLPFMQMYFCSGCGCWKKGAFFSLQGRQYRLKMRVVLLEQSLHRDPSRSLLCGRWLSSRQSMFMSLPRRQLYSEAARRRSLSRSTDLYCSLGSTTTILESSLEQEYFSSSSFCPLMSERRLQSTLCLALFFSSIIITFSDCLAAMGSMCSLRDDSSGSGCALGTGGGCRVSLQLCLAWRRLLGRSMVCEILSGVLQYCFLLLFINNKIIKPTLHHSPSLTTHSPCIQI